MLKKKSENVRLRYCDGKDKYLHPMGVKDVENIYFLIKQLAKHLILSEEWLIKRTEANETFVTNFGFILTQHGILKYPYTYWRQDRRM